MTSRTAPDTAAFTASAHVPHAAHGYPPPAQPAGSIVVSYCGEPMIVRGEFTSEPPLDTCAECVDIWQRERRGSRRS